MLELLCYTENIMQSIGERIRELRKNRKLSLSAVAQDSGLSVGFLSQVERGISSPSVASLEKICKGLEIGIQDLFSQSGRDSQYSEDSQPVSNKRNQIQLQIGDSPVQLTYLSGLFPERKLEILVGRFPPNYRFPRDPEIYPQEYESHGGEEFGYVLEGTLYLEVDGTQYTLTPGESYHFASSRKHGFATPAKEGAVVLWVQTEVYIELQNVALFNRLR